MQQEERDLLIRVETKVESVQKEINELSSAKKAQWQRIDETARLLAESMVTLSDINQQTKEQWKTIDKIKDDISSMKETNRWMTWTIRGVIASIVAYVAWLIGVK